MKHFKSVALASLMALFALQLAAQPGPRPGGGPGGGMGRGFQMSEEDIKRQVDDLSQNLTLSQEQHKQLMDYEMEFYTRMQVEMEKMRNNQGDFDREAMRERMMQVRDERNKKYESVLTKDQLDKYNQIQEQRRTEMRRQFEEGSDNSRERPERGRGRN